MQFAVARFNQDRMCKLSWFGRPKCVSRMPVWRSPGPVSSWQHHCVTLSRFFCEGRIYPRLNRAA